MFESFENSMNELDTNFREQYFQTRHVPQVLYQYTDIHGLKGILDNKNWRATHYRYLNDGKEIIYADEMICGYLEQRLTEISNDEILEKVYEDVLGKKYGPPSIFKPFGYDIYVISFSENGDLLDQWRAYASDGKGYSIGIRPHDLRGKIPHAVILPRRDEELAFVKVSYDPDEQFEAIEDLVKEAERIIQDAGRSVKKAKVDDFCRRASSCLGSILMQLTLIFKHPAFKNEQEWRVVKSRFGREVSNGMNPNSLEGVMFRVSGDRLVPYLEVGFSANNDENIVPIKEVILGSKQNQDALDSLKMYLQALGYTETDHMPKLRISDIPYQ